MFKHYLITRFNIYSTGNGPERMYSPKMDLDWLTARLNLFLKYCAPSILQQTTSNFTWLIYLHPQTPELILNQLKFLEKNKIEIQLIFLPSYELMLEDLIHKIRNASTPFVITSRIDNDDLISKFFIENVQNAFLPEHNRIINFNSGYEYSIVDKVLKRWNTRFKNQFISIIENVKMPDIQSIYGFPHWRPPAGSKICNVPGPAHWTYLRHELNYSDPAITGMPVFIKPKEFELFPDSLSELPLSWWHTFLYSTKWFPVVFKRRLRI